jgi:hypothetical protein
MYGAKYLEYLEAENLGKGEVVCSIHTGSTEEAQETRVSECAPEIIPAVPGRTERKPDKSECGESVDSVPVLFGSRRPRIWLRRCRPEHRPMVRECILNYRTQAWATSLRNLTARL